MQQQLFENSQLPRSVTMDSPCKQSSFSPLHVSKQNYLHDILSEEFLWDMRCWDKPKWQYTHEQVVSHIQRWLQDQEEDRWTFNCGYCVYCMKILLERKWATIEEIAAVVLRNTKIKYSNSIGTWGEGIFESGEEVSI